MDFPDSLTAYTFWLMVCTAVLAISTTALWLETNSSRRQSARQSAEAREAMRANVAIDVGEVFHAIVDNQPGYRVHIQLRNFGGTAAMRFRTWLAPPLVADPAALPFGARTVPVEDQATSIVGPGGTVQLNWWATFGPEDVALIRAGNRGLFVWGGAEYQDVFGKERSFLFRIRVMGPEDTSEKWALTPHPLGYEAI